MPTPGWDRVQTDYVWKRITNFSGRLTSGKGYPARAHHVCGAGDQLLCIGYRLRWRSDIWSTNRGAADVGTPDIRPTTEDKIRHIATTQDKDLLRIIMPFCFRFYFHYRMLRKKAKQPFEASSLKFS